MTTTGTDPAEDVRRHLEDCGYRVERPRANEPSLLLARQPDRPTLVVKVFPGAMRFNTAFRLSDDGRIDRLRLLESVNEFNRRGIGVCVCLNLRGELAVEGWLYTSFDRVTFTDFLRRVWDRELDRLTRDPAFVSLEAHESISAGHDRP
jgi:hypothetical protein